MPENESKSSGTSGPVSRDCDRGVEEAKGISADRDGPGHPSDESAAEPPRPIPPQENSGEPPETLHSALVRVCGENYPNQEVGEIPCVEAAWAGRVRPGSQSVPP